MKFEIDASELEGYNELFQDFGPVILDAAEKAVTDALDYLQSQIPPDPTGDLPAGYPSPLRTDKQRRWWFAHLKRSNLQDWMFDTRMTEMGTAIQPYIPLEPGKQLRDAFKVQVKREFDQIVGDLSTDLPYAPWVVGPEYPGTIIQGVQMYQARIHAYQHRWWRFEEVVDENEDAVWQVFQTTFSDEIDKFFDKMK